MRNYEPDGSEPTDFDSYYGIPAQTAKDVAVRVYVKIERHPQAAEHLDRWQTEAITAYLRWVREHRARLRAQSAIPVLAGKSLQPSWGLPISMSLNE